MAIFQRQMPEAEDEAEAEAGAEAGAEAEAGADPQPHSNPSQSKQSQSIAAPPHLYNRVVRIDGEDEYEYWFVLTYLPDLQWCHVAPIEKRGVFRGTSTTSDGRDRWMLVSEDEGGEMDVGAARCHVMQAIEMKKTHENADEEEWDILGPQAL